MWVQPKGRCARSLLYLRRYVLQISLGFSGRGLFSTRFRYCAASELSLPWPASSSVFRFMALKTAGFTCDIYKTPGTGLAMHTSAGHVHMFAMVWELTRTHTHTHKWFGEAKKRSQIYKHPGFCLTTGQVYLPGVHREKPWTLLCDMVAWIKPPPCLHVTRSCSTKRLQTPPLSECNDCCEESNSEVKLSRGEVKKDDVCMRRGTWPVDESKIAEAQLSLHHKYNENHLPHFVSVREDVWLGQCPF